MIIKGKILTAEQERKYNEIMDQWTAEMEKITPWEGAGFALNDREANRPYRLLARKYQSLIYAIVDEAPSGYQAGGAANA